MAATSRPELQIEPEEVLNFRITPIDGNTCITAYLNLTNPDKSGVTAFKVKTTMPTWYTVKPSQGILSAGSSITVQVQFNPDRSNLGVLTDYKKHKFKVETLSVADYDSSKTFDQLWKAALESGQSKTESKVIRVTFGEKQEESQERTDEQKVSKPASSPGPSTPSKSETGSTTSSENLEIADELSRLRSENRTLKLAFAVVSTLFALWIAFVGGQYSPV